jgi:hypothetical protein
VVEALMGRQDTVDFLTARIHVGPGARIDDLPDGELAYLSAVVECLELEQGGEAETGTIRKHGAA